METTKKIATITLIILLAVIAYGLFRTGRSTTASQTTPGSASSQAAQGSAIDQTPLDTARRLVQMPTSADELPLAEEALRLGDREMDLAFAAAVSEARMHPVVLSADAKQIQARLQNAEKSHEHSPWFKILNREYSQKDGREELFERERHSEPVAGWHSCALACAGVEGN